MIKFVLISIVCVGLGVVGAYNNLVSNKPTWRAGCEMKSYPGHSLGANFYKREEGLTSEEECRRSCEEDTSCGSYEWYTYQENGPCDKIQLNEKLLAASGLEADEIIMSDLDYMNLGMKTCVAETGDNPCGSDYTTRESDKVPASDYLITKIHFQEPTSIDNDDCLSLCDKFDDCRIVVWKEYTVGDVLPVDLSISCALYTDAPEDAGSIERCREGDSGMYKNTRSCKLSTKECVR